MSMSGLDLSRASVTCLPPARVKSPVCEATILNFGSASMTFLKPSARSMAGAEPVVPSSWAILTLDASLNS